MLLLDIVKQLVLGEHVANELLYPGIPGLGFDQDLANEVEWLWHLLLMA
jgi:hypothetical protein